MNIILAMTLFWTLYGIAGIFGFQKIHPKYKGHSWTKSYIRCQGISWLMLGFPMLVMDRLLAYYKPDIDISFVLLLLIVFMLAAPSIMFTVACEKKYAALLQNEADEQA